MKTQLMVILLSSYALACGDLLLPALDPALRSAQNPQMWVLDCRECKPDLMCLPAGVQGFACVHAKWGDERNPGEGNEPDASFMDDMGVRGLNPRKRAPSQRRDRREPIEVYFDGD